MIDPAGSSVCAVVVAYYPEPAELRALLGALLGQVAATVVVDNTSPGSPRAVPAQIEGATDVLRQTCNVGLAAAQNLGIGWARLRGYRYVLILDQDSLPAYGMVAALLQALQRLGATGKVAAVGPRFHDSLEDRDAPFVRIGFPFNRKRYCEREEQTVGADFLISSGALIPMAVLDAVGDMDAGLFIDNVDLEWSFRARARGYGLHGVCGATMHHRLGDTRHPLPLWLGPVVVHGSERLYYMMRNRVTLYRMQHTPAVWVAQDVPRVLVKLFLFGALIGPRGRHVRYMLRGLWDGLCGKKGACPLGRV